MALGIHQRGRLDQQCLEPIEHHPRQDFITAFGFVAGVQRFYRIGQKLNSGESFGAQQAVGVKAQVAQVGLGDGNGIGQRRDALFDRRDNLGFAAVVTQRVLRQGFAQALEHAVVVHDQAKVLAGVHPVGAGNGLHQRMRPHGLVDVERRQAFHVKPGEPHGAHHGNAERVPGVLERGFHIDAQAVCGLEPQLHHRAVRDDVKAPAFEVSPFVLRFADDQLDDGFVHPRRLGQQPVALRMQQVAGFVIGGFGRWRLSLECAFSPHGDSPARPLRVNQLEHAGAGDLVDAHQHGLAGFPAGAAMLDKISGYAIQPRVGGDDFVVLAQQLFQQGGLVGV
jgi:hypothetical protein